MARRTEDRTEAESRPPTGRESGRKPLHLNAFLMSTGHHEASWRLPGSPAEANADIEHYKNLARIAERGKLDSLFLADSPVLMGDPGRRPAAKLEPTVLLTALAGPPGTSASSPPPPPATTSRTTWPAGSPRWTMSRAAGPAGTSSPPRAPTRPATSASTTRPCTRTATGGPESSSRSPPSCGTAGRTTQ